MDKENKTFVLTIVTIITVAVIVISIIGWWMSEKYESVTGKIVKVYPIENSDGLVIKFRIFFDNEKSYEISEYDYSNFINGYSDRLTIQFYKYTYHDTNDYHINQIWKLDSYKDVNY